MDALVNPATIAAALLAAGGLVFVGIRAVRHRLRRMRGRREWIDPIMIRTYEGTARVEAADRLAADAEALAAQGLHVLERSWDEPRRTGVVSAIVGGHLAPRTGTLTVVFKPEPTDPTRWVRRTADALGEWHLLPRGSKSPHGVVLAACGTDLGDDEAMLEKHDSPLLGSRCSNCQGIILRWG